MKRHLVDRLVDPLTAEPLELTVFEQDGPEVMEGVLRSSTSWYPVERGVPQMLTAQLRADFGPFARRHGLTENVARGAGDRAREQAEQTRTNTTFADKWKRFRRYGFEPSHRAFLNEWYAGKLGVDSDEALVDFYRSKKMILEVGPGSGFNTRFMAEAGDATVIAADITEAAVTTYDNTRDLANCHVVQADLFALPLADASFDLIMADGVLHHTPDTRRAVEALYRKLEPGGQFFFYVYRQMGAARRFCDEHIREQFTKLDPEHCYEACEGLTELGRELSRLGASVTLEKGIPVLGVPPGTHDVQRLLYYSFLKCFWNDAFDWETNNMVNFDWYHPHHAWQHTEEEVRGWLTDLGVEELTFNPANPNGISVVLRRPT